MGLYRSTNPFVRALQDGGGRLTPAECAISDRLRELTSRIRAEAEATIGREARTDEHLAAAVLEAEARRVARGAIEQHLVAGALDALAPALPDRERADLVRQALIHDLSPDAAEPAGTGVRAAFADIGGPDPPPAPGAPDRPASEEEEAGPRPPVTAVDEWHARRLGGGASDALRADLLVRGRAIAAQIWFGEPPGRLDPDVQAAPLETAPTGPRIAALFLDSFLLGGIASLAIHAFATLRPLTGQTEALLISAAVSFVLSVGIALLIAATGTSPGKYVAGLRVSRIGDGYRRVPAGAALLRETIGRLISGVPFALGYLTALGDPLRLTWADRLAQTRVVRDPVRRARRGWVLLVALASGALQVSTHLSSLDPRRLQLADSVSNRILALSAQHDSIGIVYARDVEDTLEYARDMRDVLVRSTAFDADLQEVRAAVQHLRRTAAPPWTAERRVFGALDSLLGVFLAQSRLRQAAAHAVLEGGFVEDRPRFIREVRYLDSDANYLSGEVQRILQTIGAGDGT